MFKIYFFVMGVTILMDQCCLSLQHEEHLKKTIRKEYECQELGSEDHR